jgi:hypothetical protein
MKRSIASIVVCVSMWFAGSLPAWASDSGECSNASLRGSYGFQRQGFNPAVGHVGGLGVATFDGNGNWSGVQTNVTEAGGITRNTFTDATYQVNPNCTGSTADVSGTTTFDLVIVSGGNEVLFIATNEDPPGAQRVVTVVGKKLD